VGSSTLNLTNPHRLIYTEGIQLFQNQKTEFIGITENTLALPDYSQSIINFATLFLSGDENFTV
jgi:hypothetical protein